MVDFWGFYHVEKKGSFLGVEGVMMEMFVKIYMG